MNLKAVRDAINKLNVEMRSIIDKMTADNRLTMTAEEKTTFDKMDEDRKALLETEQRLAIQEDIERRFASSAGRVPAVDPTPNPADPNRVVRARAQGRDELNALRAWLLSASDVAITSEQRAVAQRVGLDLGQRRLTFRLPEQALRSIRREDIAEWTERLNEERALSTLSGSSPVDGYYTIANEAMRPLEEALLSFGGMRQVSTILRTATGAALPFPTVNDTSNKGEILTENTQVNQKDVAFNQLVLNSFLYSSKMILVSIQLLQDSSVNLGAFLGSALGERIGRITNEHFTTGNGTTEPNGIATAATASGTQLAAQTPTYPELVAIQHSVDPAYRDRPGCRWMFHDSMLAEIKKMVDASTGRPLWMPSFIGGEPDTVLGKPYTINQDMAPAAGSGAGRSILFGDLSKYQIRDVREVTLMRLDERFADYHQVAFLAFSRHDGDLLDAGTHPVKYALNKS